MQITLKDIIVQFEKFSKEHEMINSFSWGELFNLSTKDTNFPLLHVLPKSSQKKNSLNVMNLEIYVMDIEKKDDSNLLDIMNNLYMIANDVISYFYESSEILDFEIDSENVNFYPFTGEFDDFTAGWKIDLKIQFIQTNNKCNIPL